MPPWEIPGKVGEFVVDWRVAALIRKTCREDHILSDGQRLTVCSHSGVLMEDRAVFRWCNYMLLPVSMLLSVEHEHVDCFYLSVM